MSFTAARSLKGAKESGKPMPSIPAMMDVFRKWGAPRAGELSMIAGRPGSQKSGLALFMTVQWDLPTLYFSADSSQHTASTRLASIYTGMTSEEVGKQMASDPIAAQAITNRLISSPISFVFDSEPSLDDIDAEVDAWVEQHDEYPAVIVVDNLMDVEPISDQDYASNKGILLELKSLARRTGAHVMTLHHQKEVGHSSYPAAAKDLQNKVSQSIERLFSIALEPETPGQGHSVFRIAVVKNRNGPADPSGQDFVEMVAYPAKTTFERKAIAPQGYVPPPFEYAEED